MQAHFLTAPVVLVIWVVTHSSTTRAQCNCLTLVIEMGNTDTSYVARRRSKNNLIFYPGGNRFPVLVANIECQENKTNQLSIVFQIPILDDKGPPSISWAADVVADNIFSLDNPSSKVSTDFPCPRVFVSPYIYIGKPAKRCM
jgi:hypothetical protein